MVTLVRLKQNYKEQFIKDNQEAFNYGALEEFDRRDDHFAEDGEIISRQTIEKSTDRREAYRIMQNEKSVGGIVIRTDGEQFQDGMFRFEKEYINLEFAEQIFL